MGNIQIPCIWIHNTAANQAVVETFLPGLLLFYHYVIGVNLNEKLGLMQRPRYLRLAVQNVWLSTVFVVGLYALSEARKYFEQAAIRAVVRTPAEARAAVEYYDKCLARNRLLRRLLGPEAEYYLGEDGEVAVSFYEFNENVSYQGFRDYCQSLCESLQLAEDKAVEA